jgi:DNA-binding transcriptional regulator YiaG
MQAFGKQPNNVHLMSSVRAPSRDKKHEKVSTAMAARTRTQYPDLDLPALLKSWRAVQDITQAEAAEYLCVNVRTYQEWEQGRIIPPQPMMIKKLLDVGENVRRALSRQ